MKLPNFFEFEPLNAARLKMGIESGYFAHLDTRPLAQRLTEQELDRLTSGAGIEVDFDELKILPDGTLGYKDKRVLLYIRDVSLFRGRDQVPRYHLMNCPALQNAQAAGRFARRYVIANNVEGTFEINIINGSRHSRAQKQLPVCQFCLSGLNFDGFSHGMAFHVRRDFVTNFRPKMFFDRYPIDLVSRVPLHYADAAPLNQYSDDWTHVSERIKSASGWRCHGLQCKQPDLSARELKKYLHVHHLDGHKANNRPENLRPLCIMCHAEQPMHGHLKTSPDYLLYSVRFY
jgi:hypothetical protein